MKIWSFENPCDRRFAFARARGAWDQEGNRVQPLIVEWEPSSTVIGDFTVCWNGVFMRRAVADELLNLGMRGFEPGPVEVRENSERRKRKARNRVRFPYVGPPLAELWITTWVRMDPKRTTYEEETLSDGTVRKGLVGIPRKESEWNQERGEHREWWIAREPGKGLYVRREALQGAQIFKVSDFSGGAPRCTDDFKNLVETKGYMNIAFCEIGDVI